MSETENQEQREPDAASVHRVVQLSDAVNLVEVGNRSIPKLTFPDGSTIHLMPWHVGDDHQNPAVILERWIREWMSQPVELLSDAHRDISEWLQVAKYQREKNSESEFYGMPSEHGIKASENLRIRMTPVFQAFHT